MMMRPSIKQKNNILLYATTALICVGILFFTQYTKAATVDSIEKEIQEYEATLGTLHGEKASLHNEIEQFEIDIKKTKAEIKITRKKAKLLEDTIELAQTKINTAKNNITIQKETLRDFIQLIDQNDDTTYIEAVFSAQSLSGLVDNLQYSSTLQSETKNTLETYENFKLTLEHKKQEYDNARMENEVLLGLLGKQENDLALQKQNKEILLQETEGKEEKYQELFDGAKDRKQQALTSLLSSSSSSEGLNIQEASRYAEGAAAQTGVRKEIIMAVIEQETFFGRNIGTGYYKEDMKPSLRPYFEQVCRDLGLNPEEMPVSKKPQNYQGWGGAMGYAQIMAPEWIKVRSEVARLTGNSNPSPWNGADAFMGAGILLRDKGAANPNTEFEAVGRYFAGGYWKKYSWYATSVMEKAKKYL